MLRTNKNNLQRNKRGDVGSAAMMEIEVINGQQQSCVELQLCKADQGSDHVNKDATGVCIIALFIYCLFLLTL